MNGVEPPPRMWWDGQHFHQQRTTPDLPSLFWVADESDLPDDLPRMELLPVLPDDSVDDQPRREIEVELYVRGSDGPLVLLGTARGDDPVESRRATHELFLRLADEFAPTSGDTR